MYFEFHKPIPLWKKILHAKLHILWLIGLKMLVAKAFIVHFLAAKAVFAAETLIAVWAWMSPLFSFAATPTVIQALPEHNVATQENTVYDTIAEQNKGIIIDATLKEQNQDIIQWTENSDTIENQDVTSKWVQPKTAPTPPEAKKEVRSTSAAGITTLRGYTDQERYRLHPELKPSVFKQIENSL